MFYAIFRMEEEKNHMTTSINAKKSFLKTSIFDAIFKVRIFLNCTLVGASTLFYF